MLLARVVGTVVASRKEESMEGHKFLLLRQILADMERGNAEGRSYVANLANGGLVIEYNPDYPLPDGVRQRAEQLMADIAAGSLVVPAS